eukprot:8687693-Alexandrium_andersonii.AAC.1
MSASLVGSEMCIRDRPSSVPAAGTKRAVPEPLGSVAGSGSAGPLETTPVSYTHLTLPTICSV